MNPRRLAATRHWLAASAARCSPRDLRRRCSPSTLRSSRSGSRANVVNTASNKGVLLAFVAMAQTLPVLTGGIDLSVGMIFLLTNCLASGIVVGTPLETTLGIVGVLARRAAACGALNGADRRLWPPAADHRDDRDERDLSSASRCCCGRSPAASVNADLADCTDAVRLFGVPCRRSWSLLLARRAGRLDAVPALGARPRRLRDRLVGDGGLHVRRADRDAAKFAAYTLAGLLVGDRRPVPDLPHLYGRGRAPRAATPTR